MALAVFPERMDKIDPEDVDSSLRTLENYIHYMTERTEFAITNTFRTATGLGSSAEAIALVLQDTRNKLSGVEETLGGLQGTVSGIQTSLATIIQDDLPRILETLGGIQEDIDDLDRRVTALENPEPDPAPEEGGN